MNIYFKNACWSSDQMFFEYVLEENFSAIYIYLYATSKSVLDISNLHHQNVHTGTHSRASQLWPAIKASIVF